VAKTKTFVPPFELFPTALGISLANNWVSTNVIGIKTKVCHQCLLLELFAHLFMDPPKTLASLQYSLSVALHYYWASGIPSFTLQK